jgi:hypothetical protein
VDYVIHRKNKRWHLTISPSTTGRQLALLLTGQYTRLYMSNQWVWVWVKGDTIHISDQILATDARFHMVGKIGDKLGEFRPANGKLSGRQELIAAGYDVGVENDILLVKRKGKVMYSHPTDGDRREEYRYVTRGWRVARKHSQGMSLNDIVDSEEHWWKEVLHIDVTEGPDFFRMTQKQLREWRA